MTLARWIGALGSILLVLSGPPAQAQSSASTFFHEAAQQYVGGNVEAAHRTTKQGLEVDPSDPRLLALQKKLKQQDEGRGEGRSSQSGKQGRQSSQQSEGRKPQGNQPNAAQRDAESRSGKDRPQDQSSQQSGRVRDGRREPSSTRSERSQTADRDPQSSSQTQGAETQPQNRRDGTKSKRSGAVLSRTQARRLLQALGNQEEKLLRQVQGQASEETTVEKDW